MIQSDLMLQHCALDGHTIVPSLPGSLEVILKTSCLTKTSLLKNTLWLLNYTNKPILGMSECIVNSTFVFQHRNFTKSEKLATTNNITL